MIEVNCPSCREPMGIDENDLQTEWECPSCDSAFLAQKSSDGSIHCTTTAAAKSQSSEVQPESARIKSRRRRNRPSREASSEDERDLNVSLAPSSLWQNRFPDMTPTPAPALFTCNGIGTMMYGSRDFDQATGTYVTSHCLVLAFIPIIIMSSYRVADAPAEGWFSNRVVGRGWNVLGKVPLSPLAKGYNWTVLAILLLGCLTCMFSIR